MNSFTGSLLSPVATGNASYTGLGFQPKIVLFFASLVNAAPGSVASETFGIGVGISSTDRRAVGISSLDAFAAAATARKGENTKCIAIINAAATIQLIADLVTLDADGFTLNWTVVDATTRYEISYLAFGGADLTNVKSGQFAAPLVVGTQATTGVGFKPDCLLFLSYGKTIITATLGNMLNIGCALRSQGSQFSLALRSLSGADPTSTRRYQVQDKCVSIISQSAASVIEEAKISTFDTDGFTLNWTSVSAADLVFYIALKGGNYKSGSLLAPLVSGAQPLTSIGFQPTSVLLLSTNFPPCQDVNVGVRLSLGCGDSALNETSHWLGDSNGVGTTVVSQNFSTTKVIRLMNEVGAAPTLTADADLTSLDTDGFTLTWALGGYFRRYLWDVDGTYVDNLSEAEVLYIAFG